MQEEPIFPQADNNDLGNSYMKNNGFLSTTNTNSLTSVSKFTAENDKELDEVVRNLLITNPGHQTDINDKSSTYDSPIECTDWTNSDCQIQAKNPGDLEKAEADVIIISSNNSNTNSTQSSAGTVSSSIASDEAEPLGKIADVPMSNNGYKAPILHSSEEESNEERIGTTLVKVYSRDEGSSSWRWMITSDLNQNVSEEKIVKKTYSYQDGTWSWEDQRVRLSINTADYEGSIPTPCCPIVEGHPSPEVEVKENTIVGNKSSVGGSRKAYNLLLLLGSLYAVLVAGLVIHRCGVPLLEHPTPMQDIPPAETVQIDVELFRNISLTVENSPSNITSTTAVERPEDISSDVESEKVLIASTTEAYAIQSTITARALTGLKNFMSAIAGSVGRCFQAIRKALRLL